MHLLGHGGFCWGTGSQRRATEGQIDVADVDPGGWALSLLGEHRRRTAAGCFITPGAVRYA